MKKLGLNEIRKKFIDFYISKEHYPQKSAPLVPQSDKSLLLINSGMAPLKPYFSGQITPPSKRMVSCQKCIRTGDIENVGKTSRHGTFFEMLGNFSFGDYFKKQSLEWGWEFITKELNLPTDKLWATVYLDDDEAYELWKDMGMPEERIVRLGKDDNFWEIGLGPCGPCSEIYYDRGEEYDCGCEDCKPGCDCDRYVEFWNHVFTQFSKDEDGNYLPLDNPNIDTGMGLERIACIMQGVDSIFDVDTIQYILQGVVEKSGVEYKDGKAETDISIRIITDHLRSMVFMISDGVLPSNEGRGYVLRRLIRRAARHGKLMGIEGKFLVELSDRVIKMSEDAYPELAENKEYIQKVISSEEDKFAITIDQGTEIIAKYIEEMKSEGTDRLSGEKAFKLYDTYGFPLELTEEILEENNMSADVDGFNKFMEEQKETARKGRKTGDEEAWKEVYIPEDVNATEFVGYETTETKAHLVKILTKDGVETKLCADNEGISAQLFFDRTPFYAESGGQIYDTGIIFSSKDNSLKIIVEAVTKSKGVFIHNVKILSGEISVGDELILEAHQTRRNMIARNHTATHLLHKALKETLGDHVQQAGSFVGEKSLRFDFSHFEAMTEEQLNDVESKVNQIIEMFIPIGTEEMTMDQAMERGATALFGEKYGENVRVVSCGDYSVELCGGTHLTNSGQVGAFKIVRESGVAAGVRRIEAVTGLGIYNIANTQEKLILEVCENLKCKESNLVDKTKSIIEELKDSKKEIEDLKKQSMGNVSGDLSKSAKTINGIQLITKEFTDLNVNDLRGLSDDIKKEMDNVVMVFAIPGDGKVNFLVSVSDDLVGKGIHAGKFIKEVAKAAGGSGGGKADMAQAGGKDPSKINDSFAVAEELLSKI